MIAIMIINKVNYHSGVYCLLKDGKIVYIGSSSNVLRRVGWHLDKKEKDFNEWSLMCSLTDKSEMLETEGRLIHKHKPKLNKYHKGRKMKRLKP